MSLPAERKLRLFFFAVLSLAAIAFARQEQAKALDELKAQERGKILSAVNKEWDKQEDKRNDALYQKSGICFWPSGFKRLQTCEKHVGILTEALIEYGKAHGGILPERAAGDADGQTSWVRAIRPILAARKREGQRYQECDAILRHPGVKIAGQSVSYEFNPRLYGASLRSLKYRPDFFLREREACSEGERISYSCRETYNGMVSREK